MLRGVFNIALGTGFLAVIFFYFSAGLVGPSSMVLALVAGIIGAVNIVLGWTFIRKKKSRQRGLSLLAAN